MKLVAADGKRAKGNDERFQLHETMNCDRVKSERRRNNDVTERRESATRWETGGGDR